MCLNKVSLNLKYDKKRKEFIGIGYKSICDEDRYSTNWMTAKGVRSYSQNKNTRKDFSLIEYADDGTEYFPGFHIFLDIKNAISYYTDSSIYLVEYKNVVSYGLNETGNNNFGSCVIATQMRLKKKVGIVNNRKFREV